MPLTATQSADFEAYARNPETWAFAARRSLAVARVLNRRLEELGSARQRDTFEVAGCHHAAGLYSAAAVENALKGVFIAKDPAIVTSEGLKLPRVFGRNGHALVPGLPDVFGALEEDELRLAQKLEELAWVGRFVVPRSPESLYNEEKLQLMRTALPDEFGLIESLVRRLIHKLVPDAT